jgi:hypothetical protein
VKLGSDGLADGLPVLFGDGGGYFECGGPWRLLRGPGD